MTPEERAALGDEAQRLIGDPLYERLCLAVDEAIKEETFRSKVEDAATREALYAEYHAFRRVMGRLSRWVADGDLARQEIEQRNGLA